MWESQRWEAEEIIPVGDDRVLVAQRIVSVGRDGVETVAHNANVVTLSRIGKAVHFKAFQTKADALEAAGLSERAVTPAPDDAGSVRASGESR